MKGGTLLERIIAWCGVGLLAFAMVFAFSTAFDPRFGVDSPLWIGGFLPLVWLIAAIRQLVAWYEGRRASRFLDPVRASLGRRALPTLAWIAAPMFTGVLLYAVLRRGGVVTGGLDTSEGLIRSGGTSLALLYGSFFVTLLLLVIMPMASDRRDRLATEAAGGTWVRAPAQDEKALRAAEELPSGMGEDREGTHVAGPRRFVAGRHLPRGSVAHPHGVVLRCGHPDVAVNRLPLPGGSAAAPSDRA